MRKGSSAEMRSSFSHVTEGEFWNRGTGSGAERRADRTEPCTYWGCAPGLRSHPHTGTWRSRRCWCIAGCTGEWRRTRRRPRKSFHHPWGESPASIYTEKETNRFLCPFATGSGNGRLTSAIDDDQSVNLGSFRSNFPSISVTRAHIKYLKLLVSASPRIL